MTLLCVSHTNIAMCGSLNFQELHKGYWGVVKLLRVFNELHVGINNDECIGLHGGFFFWKFVIV
jgi:hypothetical protein